MPVWSVQPSCTNVAACSAMARSMWLGAGSSSVNGGRSPITSTSTASTWTRCAWSASTPNVRGRCGFASTINSRSGSAATRCISATVAPACSERLIHPSGSGIATAEATTRGANCSAIVTNRRKSAGTNSTPRAAVDQDPLGGPEETADIAHARLGEERIEVEEQRAEHVEVFPVVAFTERVQQRRRLTRPQRHPEGVTRPEQCGGFRRRALLHDL